jgi:hypothetical protein
LAGTSRQILEGTPLNPYQPSVLLRVTLSYVG